ncbi:MAG: hypothetical protein LUD07_09030 [Clostridiales bacterium]|nr:hypothetical protein [Clostridiales bacterium]
MKGFAGKLSNREVGRFLLPLFVSTVFRNGYTMVNAAVSGRFLTPGALAVIVACGSCLSMESYLYVSMTTGFGFFINRCIGSGDIRRQRESLWGSLWLCLCMIILGMFLSRLADMVMTLANIPDYMCEEARPYMRVILFGGGFWALENLLVQVAEALGESRIPAVLSMMSVVVQTCVMVLIIHGGLGVEASALAVLINHIWVAALLFFWVFRQPVGKKLLTSPCLPKGPVWSELLKNGCSKSFMMIMIGLGAFLFHRGINTLPEEILIGYSYGQVPVDFLMSSLGAFAVTAGLITGQNRGSDRIGEADRWNQKLLIVSTVLCAVYIVGVLAFAPAMIRFLSGTELSGMSLVAGSRILRIQICALPLVSCYIIMRNSLQSMGVYRALPLLGGLEAAICLIFAWVLMPRYGYTVVCWSAAVKWGIPAVIGVLIYRKCLKNEMAE